MRFILVLLSILFFSVSCGKNREKTVKGRVLNPVTGEGIANARVILQKEGGGIPSGLETVEAVYTDANGNFEISSKKMKVNTAQVVLALDDYYSLGWKKDGVTYSILSVKKGMNEADYWAVPYGEIKISIHNVNCQGSDDSLFYNRTYSSFPEIEVFQPFVLTGCYDNDGAFAKVPSGNYLIEWTVIRNGVSNSYSHTLLIPANGQASYNIDY